MQNNNSKAGAEVQQSTEADVTTSSSHNAKPIVSRRCYLVGYEFNDIWKKPDLYKSVNKDGILETAQDEFSEACLFNSVEKADEVREFLQENFNDYTWYVMLSNGG